MSAQENNRKSLSELDEALFHLDQRLAELHVTEPIQIKAIGGYALMKHGVRDDDALTVDIDSLVPGYRRLVVQAIEDVARARGLNDDWLNTDGTLGEDPSQVESMYEAEWEPQNTPMKQITLSIASVPTLTRSKIIAASDALAGNSPRTQDAPDLIRLVRHQGITDLKTFDKLYPMAAEDYAEARQHIGVELGALQASPAAQKAKKSVYARFPELADDFSDLDSSIDDASFDDYY